MKHSMKRSMKSSKTVGWTAAVLMISAVPASLQCAAQSDRTGVSKPDAAAIVATPDASPAIAATAPTAPVSPVNPPAAAPEAFLPYTETGGIKGATAPGLLRHPESLATSGLDANGMTIAPVKSPDDPDYGIVTFVPSRPGEISVGAVLKVRLMTDISTARTAAGSDFSARVAEDVLQNGKVVLPAGSIIDGQVTAVRGGRRIGGTAMMHLEPQTVTTPGGTRFEIHARVIDTDLWRNTRVDGEGTIKRRDHVKGTLAVLALTTGSAASAGAVFGGAGGALIGAGVGAGISAVWWLKQDRQTEMRKDVGVVFSLTAPMTIAMATALASPAAAGTAGGE